MDYSNFAPSTEYRPLEITPILDRPHGPSPLKLLDWLAPCSAEDRKCADSRLRISQQHLGQGKICYLVWRLTSTGRVSVFVFSGFPLFFANHASRAIRIGDHERSAGREREGEHCALHQTPVMTHAAPGNEGQFRHVHLGFSLLQTCRALFFGLLFFFSRFVRAK